MATQKKITIETNRVLMQGLLVGNQRRPPLYERHPAQTHPQRAYLLLERYENVVSLAIWTDPEPGHTTAEEEAVDLTNGRLGPLYRLPIPEAARAKTLRNLLNNARLHEAIEAYEVAWRKHGPDTDYDDEVADIMNVIEALISRDPAHGHVWRVMDASTFIAQRREQILDEHVTMTVTRLMPVETAISQAARAEQDRAREDWIHIEGDMGEAIRDAVASQNPPDDEEGDDDITF